MPKGIRQPAEERFWLYVEPEPNSGCWLWTGGYSGGGYAGFHPTSTTKVRAHIFAYKMLIGDYPPGLDLDHKCRVRCCVNPWHLEPVTRQVNLLRGKAGHHMKGRTHCFRGHEFTPENTHTDKRGRRACRICMLAHRRKRYARTSN